MIPFVVENSWYLLFPVRDGLCFVGVVRLGSSCVGWAGYDWVGWFPYDRPA